MTGYRSGFIAGDLDIIAELKRFRPHPGCAGPDFVSKAAEAAWGDDSHPEERRRIFGEKRELFLDFFKRSGIAVHGSEASFYLWIEAPSGFEDAESYASALMEQGIVLVPGSSFGRSAGRHLRLALAPPLDVCRKAIRRWEEICR